MFSKIVLAVCAASLIEVNAVSSSTLQKKIVRRDADDCSWDKGNLIIRPLFTDDADNEENYVFIEIDIKDQLSDIEAESAECDQNGDICTFSKTDPKNLLVLEDITCKDIDNLEVQLYNSDTFTPDDKEGEYDFKDEARDLVPSDEFTVFSGKDLGFTDGEIDFEARIESTSDCTWDTGTINFVPILAKGLDDEDFLTGTTEPYVYLNPIFVGSEDQQSADCDYVDGEDDNDCIFSDEGDDKVKNTLTFPNVRCNSIQEFKVEMYDNDTGFDDKLGEFDWMFKLKTMKTGDYIEYTEALDSTIFSNGDLNFKVQIVVPETSDSKPSPSPSASPIM